MSVYSYTVNVDISVAAKDVSVDPLNIEEGSRDVKSATADVSLSVVSYTADVDTNSEWLASVDRDTLTLPTDQCRFLFDVSNPNCYPGAGGTLFDLSGNERNCEIRQLSTNADATGVSSNGPADDSGTLLDSFEASSDSIGSYVSLNKDKTVNTKYLRWQAPSDVPSSFTAFMVSAGANVADYAEEDDIDVELNDAIIGKTDNLWFSSRGGGGYAHRNLYTSVRARFNYGASTDGVPNPQYAYYFYYRVGHTLYTIRDYYIYSQGRYILQDASYTDEFVARYANVGNDLFTTFSEPGGVGNGIQRTSMAPAGPDVFSVTYEGNKARTYVNGKFVGERDVSSSRNDSSSGTWIAGVANNNDSTLRASTVQSGDIYAWGFYDRTFTEEEHLNIHKKFAQDVSPSKSVDLLNYPSYVQFNIADDIGRPDANVDIDLSSSVTSVSVDIPFSASNAVDLSIDPLFKTLWRFKSDFSTSTSNPFPIYLREVYQGQQEELYDVSYNQTGPDGLDGWLKIELKRDFRVGYTSQQHPNGEGFCDGFGPFVIKTIPNGFDWDINGGTIDSSTDFKWTDAFDSFLAKGVNNQPPAASYSMSFKLAYSQAAPSPVADSSGISPLIFFETPNIMIDLPSGTDFSAIGSTLLSTFDASPDSTSTPGLTDSFFNFSNTVRGGLTSSWLDVSDIEEVDSNYFPVLSAYSYKELVGLLPFSPAEQYYLNAPWNFQMRPMRFSTSESLDNSGIVVPSGFYIMLKDISWQSDTVPSDTYYGDPPVQESRIDPDDRL